MTSSNCPLCGSSEIADAHSYPGEGKIFFPKEIANCGKCGLGRAIPMPDDQQLNDYYNGDYWEASEINISARKFPSPNVLGQSRWKHIEEHLKNQTNTTGLKLLDVGAGHGFLGLHAAKSKNVNVSGYHVVEPDKNLRDALQTAWSAEDCILTSCESLEKVDEKFDIIALCHVLEHVNDPLKFLNNITSKLNPGGLLFIEVPNRDDHFKSDVFPHTLFFDQHSLPQTLNNAGLTNISCEIRGPSPEKSVLSDQPNVFRKKFSRRLFRLEKYLPVSLLTTYYNWLLAPEHKGQSGVWLRTIGFAPK
ncbi:MAG: class I SAM-dependent methyltransferase [Alphaproteobacteria bacterium]|nr:class I SAM-dependent methyltransferase [Alphaproteobacteria bacterium]